eukprot:1550563-Pleurochrysis_carterae.AAC.2
MCRWRTDGSPAPQAMEIGCAASVSPLVPCRRPASARGIFAVCRPHQGWRTPEAGGSRRLRLVRGRPGGTPRRNPIAASSCLATRPGTQACGAKFPASPHRKSGQNQLRRLARTPEHKAAPSWIRRV